MSTIHRITVKSGLAPADEEQLDVTPQDQTPGIGVAGSNEPDAALSGKALSQTKDIPQATVARLATYLRVLSGMGEEGTLIVSSEELATAAGVGSAKLRKDLSFLGSNGVRGVGYDVARLRARIELALGLDRGHRVVLVGVGNLGRALAGYGGFGRRGFSMVGLFDIEAALIGATIGGLVVRDIIDLDNSCAELDPTIAVVAVPDESAQAVCDRLVQAGLRCILSFSPMALAVPAHVEVRRVDLAVEMQMLSFSSARNAAGDEVAARIGISRAAHSASAGSAASGKRSVVRP